jgi:hypothetical protein
LPTVLVALAAAVITFGFHGCASQYTPARLDHPYGFFMGIWHGMICPFAVLGTVASWALGVFGVSFLDSVAIIGRANTGYYYYVGFVLGLGLGALEAEALNRDSNLHRVLRAALSRLPRFNRRP